MDTAPPTGTVTFLFTDIEGSTRLWQQHPDAMGTVLAKHDALLREVVGHNGGRVFKTVGDACCAAFATAPGGLAAALAVQRALMQAQWPAGMRIAVRMALHTGTAEVRDDDYFGQPLNRVARLLAAGHGGQVLLSLATQELVRDCLPAGIALRDLGERRLKDLVRPERVYQVVAPDLPADFAPLNTLDARAHNLPIQITTFVGREKEIAEVKDLLNASRLVTLSGTGGAGKTRLALQVAADRIDEFADGVWFVDLSRTSDANLLPQLVATALGVKERPEASLIDTLTEEAKDKELLLILDNCEHLVQACADLSHALLSTCGRIRILATSREALRLTGEAEYRVPPLATPDPKRPPTLAALTQYASVQLFIDRAVAVLPAFRVDNGNAPAVADICHQLDGIPLAIELAAARVRTLSIADIHHRLDQRFRLLQGGSRAALPRQQTLRALIDWSYELLNGAERALLDRLAVFAGGFTLEAAEQVCAGGDVGATDVLDLLTSLADKSLVVVEPAGAHVRYRLLETVRQYAVERLRERDEEAHWRRRHLAHFRSLAEESDAQLSGADALAAIDRLETEHDNVRAALKWSCAPGADASDGLGLAAAIWRFWLARTYHSEGRSWLSSVLAANPRGEHDAARAKALQGAGLLAVHQSDKSAAQACLDESLAIRRALGDRIGIADTLSTLAIVAVDRGDYPTARALQEEVLAVRRELGDRFRIAVSLENIGGTAIEYADYATARARLEEALAIFRELETPVGMTSTLFNLGMVAREQGDPGSARALFEECLALSNRFGNRRVAANALNGLALVAADTRDHAGARPLHAQALAEFSAIGDRWNVAWALEGLAHVMFFLDGPVAAARLWGGAERLRERIHAPLPPAELRRYKEQVAAARAAAGAGGAFDRAWEEGRAQTTEQLVAAVLAANDS